MLSKEFDECLRSIIQMDYGLVIISHAVDKTFKDENDKEFNQIVPTLDKRARNIVSRACDIIGYSRSIMDDQGASQTRLFMRGTPRYIAGSRFKYTPDSIEFNYTSLVDAIGEAIDKQMAEDGQEYFTDTRINLYTDTTKELNFDTLMETFNNFVNRVMDRASQEEFQNYWYPRITQITDKYLGRGMKVSQCSREQTEALSLIVDELQELISSSEVSES